MSEGAFYTNQWGLQLRETTSADDFLHPELCSRIGKPNCVETQLLGFSIPEENIHSINWWRHHPNMGHLCGGTFVFQGIKRNFLESELCDFRTFMTDAALKNDLHSVTLDNGYHSEVIEPMKRHRITYSDPFRKNSYDIHYTAVAPAAALAKSSGHFDQTMLAKGELYLRGKRFDVDALTIRDRTWGEVRDEKHASIPAVSWMAGRISDDFSFVVLAHDHPDLDPVWKGHFDLPAEKVLLAAWIWRDGEMCSATSIRKITRYDEINWCPRSFEFQMTDTKGREYDVKGKITAAAPYSPYLNIQSWMCLADMTVNGVQAHCDFQDLQWTDFLNAVSRR